MPGRRSGGLRSAGAEDTSGGDMSTEVLAIFGPTASGKTAVAELVAGRLGGRGRLCRDSMQVYRGVPILTAQPARPTAARRDLAAFARGVGRRVRRARAHGRRRARRGGTGANGCRRHRSLPPCGARRPERPRPHLRRGPASAGSGVMTPRAQRPSTPSERSATPRRRPPSTRTTAAASSARSARRRRRLAAAPPDSRLWGEETRGRRPSSASSCRPTSSNAASSAAPTG